jgi:hypothetical protein
MEEISWVGAYIVGLATCGQGKGAISRIRGSERRRRLYVTYVQVSSETSTLRFFLKKKEQPGQPPKHQNSMAVAGEEEKLAEALEKFTFAALQAKIQKVLVMKI